MAPKRKNTSLFCEYTVDRFWSQVDKTFGCWFWLGTKFSTGYGMFQPVGRETWPAHRYAYAATFGIPPKGLNVCHRCDNPSCVRPDHLFLGTQSENIKDCFRKGRANNKPPTAKLGTANPMCRISELDVRAIRWLAEQGTRKKLIAIAYSLNYEHVRDICKLRVWRHV